MLGWTLVGPGVDEGLALALALVDRARPGVDRPHLQPVQRDLAEMSLIDPEEARSELDKNLSHVNRKKKVFKNQRSTMI